MIFYKLYFSLRKEGKKLMKMIDVLQLMSERKIKNNTILKILDNSGRIVHTYEYDAEYEDFYDTYSHSETLDIFKFVNINVVLIDPESQKYYLKLFDDDECSYVHYHYDQNTDSVDYLIGAKALIDNYQMTFNENEIKNDKLLTFIAKYGIKKEIERD